MLLPAFVLLLSASRLVASSHSEYRKRATITIAHQFDVVDESNFPDGSDALKGISPASGDAGVVTAHQFQSDCATLRSKSSAQVLSYMSLAQASCGLPYEAMKMRDVSKPFCSGMAASNFATGYAGGCGACVKLSYSKLFPSSVHRSSLMSFFSCRGQIHPCKDRGQPRRRFWVRHQLRQLQGAC